MSTRRIVASVCLGLIAFSLSVFGAETKPPQKSREAVIAEFLDLCEEFPVIVLARLEPGSRISRRCSEVWKALDGPIAPGDPMSDLTNPRETNDPAEFVVFLSNYPQTVSGLSWTLDAGRLRQSPTVTTDDLRRAVPKYPRTVPIPTIRQTVGKTTSSAEFQALKTALSLRLARRTEKFNWPTSPVRSYTDEVYSGSGLVVYATSSHRRKRGSNQEYEQTEGKITAIAVILRDCGLRYEFQSGIWKGAPPVAYLPENPTALLRRKPYPESHLVDESYSAGQTNTYSGPLTKINRVDYNLAPSPRDGSSDIYIFDHDILCAVEFQ